MNNVAVANQDNEPVVVVEVDLSGNEQDEVQVVTWDEYVKRECYPVEVANG